MDGCIFFGTATYLKRARCNNTSGKFRDQDSEQDQESGQGGGARSPPPRRARRRAPWSGAALRVAQVSAASAASVWFYVACNAAIAAFLAGERHALDGLLSIHALKAAAAAFDSLVVYSGHGGGSKAPQATSPLLTPAPGRPRPTPSLSR